MVSRASAVLFVAALLLSCGASEKAETPPDSVRVVMVNNSGQHLTKFALDYGLGRIQYEIFSMGYTFSDYARVTGEQPLTVRYYDEAGVVHELTIERPLKIDMIGGTYRLYFEKDNKIQASFDFPRPKKN